MSDDSVLYLRPPVITGHTIDSAEVLVMTTQPVEDVRVRWSRSPALDDIDGVSQRGTPAGMNDVTTLEIAGLSPGVFYYQVGVQAFGAWVDAAIVASRTLPETGESHSVTRDSDPHLGGALSRKSESAKIRVARIDHCIAAIAQATDADGLPPAAHFHLGDGLYAFHGGGANVFPIGPDGQPIDANSTSHCALSKADTDILADLFNDHYDAILSTRNTILVEGNHEGFWSWMEEGGNLSGVYTADWLRESVRERFGDESEPYGSKLIGDCLHCWANTGPGSALDNSPDGPPFPTEPADQHHHSLSPEQFEYFFDPQFGKIPNHTGWVEFTIHQKVGGCLLGSGAAYGRGDVARETWKVNHLQCFEQAGRNTFNDELGRWEHGDGTPVEWTNPFGRMGMQETHGLFGALVEMLSLPGIWGIVKHEGHDHAGQIALVDGIVCVKHSQTGGHNPNVAKSKEGFMVGGQFLRIADRPEVVLAEWTNFATWGQSDIGPDELTTRVFRSVYYDVEKFLTYEFDGADESADGSLVASITLRRPETPVDAITESFDRIVDDSSPHYSGTPGVDGNPPPPVNESVRFYTSNGDFWAPGNSEGSDESSSTESGDLRSFLAVRDSVIDRSRVLASRVPVEPSAAVAMWMRRALGGLDRRIDVTVRFDGSSDAEPTIVMVPIYTGANAPLSTGISGKGLYLRLDNSGSPSLELRWDDGLKDETLADTSLLPSAWTAPVGAAFDDGLQIVSEGGHLEVKGLGNSGASPSGNVVVLIDKQLDPRLWETIASEIDEFAWTGLSVVSKNWSGAGHVAEFNRFDASRLDS